MKETGIHFDGSNSFINAQIDATRWNEKLYDLYAELNLKRLAKYARLVGREDLASVYEGIDAEIEEFIQRGY